MTTPLVSVLMTAYNREKYIAEAMESVLASSFEDFELIVVDDRSRDRSLEIARSFEKDPRVKVHMNPENLGDYKNRNRAAELARGRYLKYVDSDDRMYPHGLEVMVKSMEAFPDAGCGLSRPNALDRPYPIQLSPEEAYREQFFGCGLFENAPLSAIMRTEAFRAVGGFSGARYIGDYEMWLRLGARFPVVKMAQGLTWWRSHGEQEMAYDRKSTGYHKLRLDVAIAALESDTCPLSRSARAIAIRRVRHRQARVILRMATVSRQPRAAWAVFRDCGLSWGELLGGFAHAPHE